MGLPFAVDPFLRVFEKYNLSIWPMQVIVYLLGIVALSLTIKKTKQSDRIICGISSFFWLWMGGVYHLVYFCSINKTA